MQMEESLHISIHTVKTHVYRREMVTGARVWDRFGMEGFRQNAIGSSRR
jgi:hypothetical protein